MSALLHEFRFRLRWWRWWLSSPLRADYGFGPDAFYNWKIATERWERREPRLEFHLNPHADKIG
jgi:hypothetical protein